MKAFTNLYWALDGTTSTTDKVAALREYFAVAAPHDAACALEVLSGGRQLRSVSTGQLRAWASEVTGFPEWLVEECYAHVGDLAETLALVLPEADAPTAPSEAPGLAETMQQTIHDLRGADDDRKREVVTAVWRRLAPRERIVWHKLLTGGLRVGVSRTLVARALAELAGIDQAEMAHRLMGDPPADGEAFSRLLAAEAAVDNRRPYPFLLASPLDRPAPEHVAEDLGDVTAWQAEWKWDGMRAQIVRRGDDAAVWSRGEELINEAFPDIVAAAATLPPGTVLDGEILAVRDGRLLGFTTVSKRAGRKRVTKHVLADMPCVFVAYDLLEADGVDLRSRPLIDRRQRLEAMVPTGFDEVLDGRVMIAAGRLMRSPIVAGTSWPDLAAARQESRARGVEGLMLKRRSSGYASGRTRGDWWKWKVEPLEIDAVLLYAQAGHGRRAGLHSDYTLGVWDGDRLVTIAKAYSGLTDTEIVEIDRIVRATTLEKHGPVRICTPTVVMQLAFEGVSRSTRHKSGVAVRFPRIVRWRRDKHPSEAGTLADLTRMIPSEG